MPLTDVVGTRPFRKHMGDILVRILKIIESNKFKASAIFDNSDYDCNPTEIINNPKITFFKRNFSRNKNYESNVVPFPFIMFGAVSLIEKYDTENIVENYSIEKYNHTFLLGAGLLLTILKLKYIVIEGRNTKN